MKTGRKKSLRLQGYDYSSSGAYFITIVTYQREILFGEIIDGRMVLNESGKIVQKEWERTPHIRREVDLGAYMIMPNHFHAIVIFNEYAIGVVGAPGRAPRTTGVAYRKPKSLGALMAGFKSSVTKQINIFRDTPGAPLWQRNYYDHIIRNDREMSRIWDYIETNPIRWAEDKENPRNW
jgi:REP element-mobilizing transposase RayT